MKEKYKEKWKIFFFERENRERKISPQVHHPFYRPMKNRQNKSRKEEGTKDRISEEREQRIEMMEFVCQPRCRPIQFRVRCLVSPLTKEGRGRMGEGGGGGGRKEGRGKLGRKKCLRKGKE